MSLIYPVVKPRCLRPARTAIENCADTCTAQMGIDVIRKFFRVRDTHNVNRIEMYTLCAYGMSVYQGTVALGKTPARLLDQPTEGALRGL